MARTIMIIPTATLAPCITDEDMYSETGQYIMINSWLA